MYNILDCKNIVVYTDKKDFYQNLKKFLPGIAPAYYFFTGNCELKIPNMRQLDSLEQIKELDSRFVLLDVPIVYDKQQESVKELIKYFIENKIPYDYISHYYKNQIITTRILKTLSIFDFINPITQNEVHISESSGQLFEIVFNENCSQSSVRIEKQSFALDSNLSINVFCSNNAIRIKNYVNFKKGSSITCYGNSELIIENECSFSENCNIICGYSYTRIDGNSNQAIAKDFRINIGKHTKIHQNTTILADTSIGNGSIVEPYSVVKGVFKPCSLIGGNLAKTLQDNVSWAYDNYNGSAIDSFYKINDRSAFKYFDNKIPVVLHGCCALTNTMLYSKKCKIDAQFFQCPLHTMFFPPIKVKKNQIEIQEKSEFLTKNVYNEFNKIMTTEFSSKAKYLIVDFGDIRWNYYEFTEPVRSRVFLHKNTFSTLMNINKDKHLQYAKKLYSDIDINEWEFYINQYVEWATTHFDTSNIILIKLPIARYYNNNGEKVYFDKNDPEIIFESLLRRIEDMFISKVKDCKIIQLGKEPIADEFCKLGITPLHLTKEAYIELAKQLDDIMSNE